MKNTTFIVNLGLLRRIGSEHLAECSHLEKTQQIKAKLEHRHLF